MWPLAGIDEERARLPNVDGQRYSESQGDIEKFGDIDSISCGWRRVDGVGATQRELDGSDFQLGLSTASQVSR